MKTLTITTTVLGKEVDEWLKDRPQVWGKEEIKRLETVGEIIFQRTPMSQTKYKLEDK